MTRPLPLAFYAPLKSPNHPSPSGDRAMARLLMKALKAAGFAPELASELRTLDRIGDPAAQEHLRRESGAAASRLIEHYRTLPRDSRPRLWFTYHVYYKAPDWIGPQVADALQIPYAIAEGSRAAKRASGPWALGHQGAETALGRADAIFVMTSHDREALERARASDPKVESTFGIDPMLTLETGASFGANRRSAPAKNRGHFSARCARPPPQSLVDLPPFVDREIDAAPASRRTDRTEAKLLVVAMMRRGDKLASYRILADALGQLQHLRWTLDIVGDGEARGEVEALLAPYSQRIRLRGQIEEEALLRTLYAEADLLVWPAVNEAYGMVLLEAQAQGCPVVAGAYGGVASVVCHGMTGLLTAPGDARAFAEAVGALLADRGALQRLGEAARRFVREERGLNHASERLRAALMPLIAGARP